MAKKTKITRKDILKKPDQFLSFSEKTIFFFRENCSAVIGSITAIIILGLSFFGYQSYQNSQMMKYEALYFNMEEISKSEEGKEDQLVKIRDQIGATPHRNRASLLLADKYFQNEDYEKAQAVFLEIKNTSKGLNRYMADVGLAYTYEAKGEYKKAIELYKSIIDAKSNFPLFQVYWSLSRCYEINNDTSSALLILREMQIKFSGPAELEKIDKRIKQLSA